MYPDVSNELLHCVVFEITIAAVHLQRLVADLGEIQQQAAGQKKSHGCSYLTDVHEDKRLLGSSTHVEALVRDEELGHGAEGHGVGAAVLQRRRCLTHQQARGDQPGGHFCQFELQKLHIKQTGRGANPALSVVMRRDSKILKVYLQYIIYKICFHLFFSYVYNFLMYGYISS